MEGLACWNCGQTHVDADAALVAHERLRVAAEVGVADLFRRIRSGALAGMTAEDRSRLLSSMQEELAEQERITGWLRSHGHLPPATQHIEG